MTNKLASAKQLYTLKNLHVEPQNGGLVQMTFPFNWVIFRFNSRSFSGVNEK